MITSESPFPFGKYKGTPLIDLPSTYIVFALETFKLHVDMDSQLRTILMCRIGFDDFAEWLIIDKTKREAKEIIYNMRISSRKVSF